LALVGQTLYLGGAFGSAGGQPRLDAAAVDTRTGQATEWNPWPENCNCNPYDGSPSVNDVVAGESTIYLAGHFSTVSGLERDGIAEVDMVTGAPTAWAPVLGPKLVDYAPHVTAMAVSDSSVYLGGHFFQMGGEDRPCIAGVSRRTAAVTSWNPRANNVPLVLTVAEDVVYAGGMFTTLGRWLPRKNLAALDLTTGEPTEWNPDPNGLIVYDVAVANDRVYVGGHFNWIGGQERWGLAALDPVTGQALDWTADTDETVGVLELAGDRLYVGGAFTRIGGQPRSHVASIDLETGQVTGWDPNPDNEMYQIVVADGTAYLGGFFRTIGGVPRRYAAAVDVVTGAVSSWDPQPDLPVLAIASHDSTVYLGGVFRNMGGLPRNRLAAVDATTGAACNWIADASNRWETVDRVYELKVVGDTLYAGGSFDAINGQVRGGLAALDAATGTVLDWDPGLGGPTNEYPQDFGVVWGLEPIGNTLYVSGRFSWAGNVPVATFAAISRAPAPPPDPNPVPKALAVASVSPNPARSDATIRFSLPSAGPVSVSVFDLQGRRIASPLRDELRAAGVHEVQVRTEGWREGFYFCLVEAGGERATRKLVVLK
jgi:nitrite reductase/ring-hydroxylating ferredoxin subunit